MKRSPGLRRLPGRFRRPLPCTPYRASSGGLLRIHFRALLWVLLGAAAWDSIVGPALASAETHGSGGDAGGTTVAVVFDPSDKAFSFHCPAGGEPCPTLCDGEKVEGQRCPPGAAVSALLLTAPGEREVKARLELEAPGGDSPVRYMGSEPLLDGCQPGSYECRPFRNAAVAPSCLGHDRPAEVPPIGELGVRFSPLGEPGAWILEVENHNPTGVPLCVTFEIEVVDREDAELRYRSPDPTIILQPDEP